MNSDQFLQWRSFNFFFKCDNNTHVSCVWLTCNLTLFNVLHIRHVMHDFIWINKMFEEINCCKVSVLYFLTHSSKQSLLQQTHVPCGCLLIFINFWGDEKGKSGEIFACPLQLPLTPETQTCPVFTIWFQSSTVQVGFRSWSLIYCDFLWLFGSIGEAFVIKLWDFKKSLFPETLLHIRNV